MGRLNMYKSSQRDKVVNSKMEVDSNYSLYRIHKLQKVANDVK